MLDTNVASQVTRVDQPRIRERLVSLPVHNVAISAVTQGELMCGLAKRGNPPALSTLVHEFLIRVEVLPWTAEVADVYGALRASCGTRGISLGALDMVIGFPVESPADRSKPYRHSLTSSVATAWPVSLLPKVPPSRVPILPISRFPTAASCAARSCTPILVALFALTGCFDDSRSPRLNGAAVNKAPVISGTPITAAKVGVPYIWPTPSRHDWNTGSPASHP
jgi:tRNA(fMet)-specific endonuclease VapC